MAQGAIAEFEIGETVLVGNVAITAEQKYGRKVRLRIVAPMEMKVSFPSKKEPGESRITAEQSA